MKKTIRGALSVTALGAVLASSLIGTGTAFAAAEPKGTPTPKTSKVSKARQHVIFKTNDNRYATWENGAARFKVYSSFAAADAAAGVGIDVGSVGLSRTIWWNQPAANGSPGCAMTASGGHTMGWNADQCYSAAASYTLNADGTLQHGVSGGKVNGVESGLARLGTSNPWHRVTSAAASTTMGVYDLKAEAQGSSGFAAGISGTIDMNSQPESGATGISLSAGQSFMWTATVPKGLTVGTLTDSASEYSKTEYTKSTNNGVTTVTKTFTRVKATDTYVANSPWSIPVTATGDLASGAKVTVTFTPKAGYTSASATREVDVPVAPAVVAPTASVEFDADVSKKAIVTGTGEEGATITVKEGNTTLGTPTTVTNGTWSIPIDATTAGNRQLTVTQTKDTDTQTVTTTAEYGAGITVTGANITTGDSATVTGTGQSGAKVVLTDGNTVLKDNITVGTGNTWTATVTGLGQGATTITATQSSKGGLTTTDTTTATVPIVWADLAVTSHANPGTYEPGKKTTFSGTATPLSTIKFYAFGTGAFVEATTDKHGNWTLQRPLGPTQIYNATFTQDATPATGSQTDRITNFMLVPAGVNALTVTSHDNGDAYNPNGVTSITGKATAMADVTLSGGGITPVTKQADQNGDWEIDATFTGAPANRNLSIKQTTPSGTETSQTLNLVSPVATPLNVTSHQSGDSYVAGAMNTFSGTATAYATVKFYAFGVAAGNPVTTTADAKGNWSLQRPLGPTQVYNKAAFTQDGSTSTPDSVTLVLNPPAK